MPVSYCRAVTRERSWRGPNRCSAAVMQNLYMTKLPLAEHSVGHVNVFVLNEAEGALLIDTGWRTEQSY